jgi:hypothetical protein
VNRQAHLSKTFDDTWKLDATFDSIGGEPFANELQRIEDQFFEEDGAKAKAIWGDDVTIDKLERTPAQRRCDALVEMAKRSASASGGSNKPLIHIVIGKEAFKDLCETAAAVTFRQASVKPTTSLRGAGADRPKSRMVNCCAASTTERRDRGLRRAG